MSTKDQAANAQRQDPAAGFVLVVDPKGQADETLKGIIPDLARQSCHHRSNGVIALAARSARRSVTVRSAPGREVVLLGELVCECAGPEEALDWAVAAVEDGRYGRLRGLQGVFVLVVIDWPVRRATVVSDLLGIKPFYMACRGGVTVLADRAASAARLVEARIDPLGLAGWMFFGAPLVNRTMFDSVRRIPPASAMVFQDETVRHEEYWRPADDEQPIDPHELMDGVCDDFAASLSRLLGPYKSATVLLSGGFDSRLCLLTGLRQNQAVLDAVTVPYDLAERTIVDELVRMTGIECRRVKVRGSIWDEFDSMWFSHPDGFPVTRNLTHLCVTGPERAGPFIDGSISSVAVRCLSADPADGPPADETAARRFVWNAHAHQKPEIYFRPGPARKFHQLGHEAADEQSRALPWGSKFCLRWDMYTDERRFTPVNFLQYADVAASVQPFYDRRLIERRLRHPNGMFTKEFYHAMLGRRFPGPGQLPHSSDVPKGKDATYAFSRVLWRQLPAAARFVHRHGDVLKRRWLLPRLTAYGLGRRRQMYVVMGLVRLMKLTQELARCGVELDFNELLA